MNIAMPRFELGTPPSKIQHSTNWAAETIHWNTFVLVLVCCVSGRANDDDGDDVCSCCCLVLVLAEPIERGDFHFFPSIFFLVCYCFHLFCLHEYFSKPEYFFLHIQQAFLYLLPMHMLYSVLYDEMFSGLCCLHRKIILASKKMPVDTNKMKTKANEV